MTYSRDIETTITVQDSAGYMELPAVFSTWLTHPDDLPTLTLEAVMFGKNKVNREFMVDWLGAAEVARLEEVHTPEDWDEAEHYACARADDYAHEVMA